MTTPITGGETPPMPSWALIAGATLEVSPWRNGRGTSRTIATRLDPAGAMLWQVGIADLAQDGPFSDYPGMDRIFTPIAGDKPPELAFHGGVFEPCPLLTPRPFPGDVPTQSRIAAPGQAFNVIVDRHHHRAAVTVLRLASGDPVALPDAPVLLLHCLTGGMRSQSIAARPGDSLLGTAMAAAVVMSQAGIVLLVAIR